MSLPNNIQESQTGQQSGTDNAGGSAVQQNERFVEFEGEKIEIPDNFWDKEHNQPNVGALAKSQNDLRRQLAEADKSPKDGMYKVNLPDELRNVVEVDMKSPLLGAAMAFCKANGISQEKFDELVRPYYEQIAAEGDSYREYLKAEDEKLNRIFGNRKEEAIQRIHTFAANCGYDKDPEKIQELKLWTSSAAGGALLLDIINGQKDIQAGNNGSAVSASYTEDQLFEMMKDPRYETDKTWQQKVSDGFKALYPEK